MQRRGSVNGSSAASSRVRVAVRVRPPDYKLPRDESLPSCVTTTPTTVEYHHEIQTKNYTYDHVFDPAASQEDVYTSALQPLMAPFLDGFNVTVMAYGQTGSGKTHTMGGKATVVNTTPTTSPCRSRSSSLQMPTLAVGNPYRGAPEDGLVPRFLNELFLNLKREPSVRTVRVTFVEIYCDSIRDLLDDRAEKNIAIREDAHNVVLENVRVMEVESLSKALELWNQGRSRQATGANALNDESSRSHAVYTMEVSRKFRSEIKKSKLTFVDLAGSERLKKTQVEGVRKRESIQINVGLSALGNVINALADAKTPRRSSMDSSPSRASSQEAFVPYRTSKLTRLLQDALGGNSRTLFVACVSPLDSNAEETLCTLQYANRARSIQNKAEKNTVDHHEPLVLAAIHPVSAEMIEMTRLQDEVAVLRQQIADLESAARAKIEEIVLAEQLRAEKKMKKLSGRRDVEVTTEIDIVPYLDAETQFEAESPAKKASEPPSTSEAGTATEPPAGQVDFGTQSGASFSDAKDEEVETDAVPALETAEASTESTVAVTDCSIQSDVSLFDRHDFGVGTDITAGIESTDASTECDVDAPKAVGVDVETQAEAPVRSVHDSEMNTELIAATETTDASTEPDHERSRTTASDVEIQFGAPMAQFRDADVATDPEVVCETTDASTECRPTSIKTEEAWSQTSRPPSPSPVHVLNQQRLPTGDESCHDEDKANSVEKPKSEAHAATPAGSSCELTPLHDGEGKSLLDQATSNPQEEETESHQTPVVSACGDIATSALVNFSPRPLDLLPVTASHNRATEEMQAGDAMERDESTKLDNENPAAVDPVAKHSEPDETIALFLKAPPACEALPPAAWEIPTSAVVANFIQEVSAFEQVFQETASTVKKGRPESLTPESHEEELTFSSCPLSENQLEVVNVSGVAPSSFISGPSTEELLHDTEPVTRSISTESCGSAVDFVLPDEFGEDDEFLLPFDGDFQSQLLEAHTSFAPQALPSALPVFVNESWVLSSARPAIDTSCDDVEEYTIRDPMKVDSSTSSEPAADFVVSRSPRRATPSQSSQRGSVVSATSRQSVTIHPLRMFAFDDQIAATPAEKAAAQAKALYTSIRELVQDEFGRCEDEADTIADSAVDQLLTETKTLIKRRRQQQQRIALLRRRVLALEELLQVEHRAPVAETDLQAYSKRVQEEFLTKLLLQLESLAAQRLHARLTARLDAERTIPVVFLDGEDSRSPFLSVTQCQSCAEWFFQRPEDVDLFVKKIMPLISSGWITLTPRDLEAEQAWFQL